MIEDVESCFSFDGGAGLINLVGHTAEWKERGTGLCWEMDNGGLKVNVCSSLRS